LPFVSDSYFSALPDTSSISKLRASVVTSHVLPPLSAIYVTLALQDFLPDGTQLLLTPLRLVLSKHSILAPHAVVTVTSHACCLPVFNLLSRAQSLPLGLKIVDVEVLPATATMCPVQTH